MRHKKGIGNNIDGVASSNTRPMVMCSSGRVSGVVTPLHYVMNVNSRSVWHSAAMALMTQPRFIKLLDWIERDGPLKRRSTFKQPAADDDPSHSQRPYGRAHK